MVKWVKSPERNEVTEVVGIVTARPREATTYTGVFKLCFDNIPQRGRK